MYFLLQDYSRSIFLPSSPPPSPKAPVRWPPAAPWSTFPSTPTRCAWRRCWRSTARRNRGRSRRRPWSTWWCWRWPQGESGAMGWMGMGTIHHGKWRDFEGRWGVESEGCFRFCSCICVKDKAEMWHDPLKWAWNGKTNFQLHSLGHLGVDYDRCEVVGSAPEVVACASEIRTADGGPQGGQDGALGCGKWRKTQVNLLGKYVEMC